MAGLKLTDVDWTSTSSWSSARAAARDLPFGRKAGEALDRYLRARARHKDAPTPAPVRRTAGSLLQTACSFPPRRESPGRDRRAPLRSIMSA
jgi:hypothetical protein